MTLAPSLLNRPVKMTKEDIGIKQNSKESGKMMVATLYKRNGS